jgi:hypothetical protein
VRLLCCKGTNGSIILWKLDGSGKGKVQPAFQACVDSVIRFVHDTACPLCGVLSFIPPG